MAYTPVIPFFPDAGTPVITNPGMATQYGWAQTGGRWVYTAVMASEIIIPPPPYQVMAGYTLGFWPAGGGSNGGVGIDWLAFGGPFGTLYANLHGRPPRPGSYSGIVVLNAYYNNTLSQPPGVPQYLSFDVFILPVTTSTPVTPTTPVVTTSPTTTPVSQAHLTWFQARAEAYAGARIARAIWADRWVEFDGYLWWLQLYDPTSKATGDRHVVLWSEWNSDAFRKSDWTTAGLPGQIASAGSNHDAIPATLGYP